MTLELICREIADLLWKLPAREREEVERCYQRSCQIVFLCVDGWVQPTEQCWPTLLDLRKSVGYRVAVSGNASEK